MRLRLAAAIFFMLTLVSACGGDSSPAASFPDSTRANFMSQCVGGVVTQSMCKCMFDSAEKKFTYEEYRAMEAGLTRGVENATFNKIVEDCVDKFR